LVSSTYIDAKADKLPSSLFIEIQPSSIRGPARDFTPVINPYIWKLDQSIYHENISSFLADGYHQSVSGGAAGNAGAKG
jgi:hypothetical protein